MSHLIFLFLHIIITTLILSPSLSTSSQTITGKIPIGSSITASPNTKSSWLSPSGDFAFGFQPLPNNTNNLFVLAIWFAKIPDQTIAWFDRHLAPLGSILTLDAHNGLVLRNSTSPYAYTVGLTAQVAYAYMNDTGNLVLSSGNDDSAPPLWQSFENPSDTILPSQTIVGLLPHQQLVSKNGESDFSYGRFYAGMSPNNFVLTTKTVHSNLDFDDEYYNSDTPSGFQLLLDVNDQTSSVSVVNRNGQRVKTILSSNKTDYYFRATLEFDGVFTLYYHPKNGNNSEWVGAGTFPGNICKEIDGQKGSGACGYNSVCSLKGSRPVCNCPEGFELVDPRDRYGACKSNFTTENYNGSGGGEYGLVVVRDVDWPFNDYEQRNRSSWEECRKACDGDYFCGAAIFRSDSCWKKRMPLSNGRVDKSLNATAFLKVRIG